MAVLSRCIQDAFDALLGRGMPAPGDAVRDAAWAPDAPWSWCPACGCTGGGCASCGGAVGGARVAGPTTVIRLGAHAGELRDWVIAVKHAKWESMGELLGAELGRQLARCGVVSQAAQGTVLVPVPTPWIRVRERGIDHARLLATAAARTLGTGVARPLRQLARGTQVDRASRVGRSAQRARFSLRASPGRCRATIAGRHAVIVDDVRTTGSTLAEVASWLRWLGAARIDAAVATVAAPAPECGQTVGTSTQGTASPCGVLRHHL